MSGVAAAAGWETNRESRAGRQKNEYHQRHASLNDIIHRALSSAHVPSRLEPVGLLRSDGKRPDGASLIPWSMGKPLIWDATCVDTFAPSYRNLAVVSAGAVASRAESLKQEKYTALDHSHIVTPIAIETSGAFGPKTLSFIKEFGRRLRLHTGISSSTQYLIQRLSMAVQRGNAVSILHGLASS